MLNTKLLRNKEVFTLLQDEIFVTEWKNLVASILGFTRYQDPEFVIPWYQRYAPAFEPILIYSYGSDEKLKGIICLALHRHSMSLIHAGNAEYHCWLALKGYESAFLKAVFTIIKKELPIGKWLWRFMPAGNSAELIKQAVGSEIKVIIEQEQSPVWELDNNAQFNKIRKSRSLKSKLNRIKRKGEIRFEKITCPQKLREVLEIAAFQYDFRQEAKNDSQPFKSDPFKIDFCADLIEKKGILHLSALWLDNKLLACHMGIAWKDTVSLGMICHDPTENYHSPGTLMLVLLAEELKKEGFKYFDLTPGSHSYKDRFATSFQTLFKPAFYFNNTEYRGVLLKRTIKNLIKKSLKMLGVGVPTLRRQRDKLKSLAQNLRLIFKRKKLLSSSFWLKKSVSHHYLIDLASSFVPVPDGKLVNLQSYQDLMFYMDHSPFLNRRALLQNALSRFSKKERLYSLVDENRLLFYAWYKKEKESTPGRSGNKKTTDNEELSIIYDIYSPSDAPLNFKLFYQYIDSMIYDLQQKEITKLKIIVPNQYKPKPDWINSRGFWHIQSISITQLFYWFKFVHVKKK